MKLAKNSFFSVLLQLFNYISPFLVLPYLTRTVGLEGFGIISLCLAVSAIALIVTDYGFGISGPVYIASHKEEKKKLSIFLSTAITIKFVLTMLTITIFGLLFKLSILPVVIDKKLLLAMCLMIITQSFLINWFFQGMEKFKFITVVTVISKLLYMLCVFVFVKSKQDLYVVFIALALGNISVVFFSYTLVYKEGIRPLKSSVIGVLSCLKYNFGYFLSRVSVSTYSTLSVIILGSLTNVNSVALYSSVEKIYQACQSLTYSLSQVLLPHISITKNTHFLHKYVLILSLLASGLIFLVITFDLSEVILIFLFGADFASASNILNVLLVCAVVNFISVNYGYPLFSAINKTHLVNYSVYLGSIIQLALILYLYKNNMVTPLFLSYSVLFTEVSVLMFRCFLYKNNVDKSENERK